MSLHQAFQYPGLQYIYDSVCGGGGGGGGGAGRSVVKLLQAWGHKVGEYDSTKCHGLADGDPGSHPLEIFKILGIYNPWRSHSQHSDNK